MKNQPLAQSRQLLLVIAPNWWSPAGELRRFVRNSLSQPWQAVGPAIKVSLGKNGLAWGIGLHSPDEAKGRIKKEGDGCAPAGIFAITELFGEAGPESGMAQAAKLPYRTATANLKCIDDPRSLHYNHFVEQDRIVTVDWLSHEEMRRDDERYELGAFIAHNSPQPQPGAGSCIFLHVWEAEGHPTAGCTASSFANIEEICRWLDGAAQPLLVQLPLAEYRRLKTDWALPCADSTQQDG